MSKEIVIEGFSFFDEENEVKNDQLEDEQSDNQPDIEVKEIEIKDSEKELDFESIKIELTTELSKVLTLSQSCLYCLNS